MNNRSVVIIGAGLAGLACATHLKKQGISFQIIEASDAVGGRVRTDMVDGFLLDRGFQVLLEAYPEAKAILDYRALQLKPFKSGAIIRRGGKFHSVLDPWRNPLAAVATALAPVGSIMDKLRVEHLRQEVVKESGDNVEGDAATSEARLRAIGLSEAMVDAFFRPFFGGIFLTRELQTSARMFDFLYRMFSEESAVLPQKGMGAIPEQLARKLGENLIRFNTTVASVSGQTVTLANGEILEPAAVVVATDALAAGKLLGETAPEPGRGVTCLYFAAAKPPVNEPLLVLNGDNDGPVNNLCVPSAVSSEYAPGEKSLISCSILGNPDSSDSELASKVLKQMESWYGRQVKSWRLLKTYRIFAALPGSGKAPLTVRDPKLSDRLFICGDHTSSASINGAFKSGRLAAEAIAQSIGAKGKGLDRVS